MVNGGALKGIESHVLRLLCHQVPAATISNGKEMALHAALSKLRPRGGFEVMRRGGSSGATAHVLSLNGDEKHPHG